MRRDRRHTRRWQAILSLGLRATAIPWFLRELYARHKVTVVNYHDPVPDVFAAHMKTFSRIYSFVGIDEVLHALEARDFSLLPPKPLLVTLDDGYVGNARLLDVLADYRVPVVIYAVAGVVGTNRAFWFDLLAHHGAAMDKLKCAPDGDRRRTMEREYGHTDEREYATTTALSVPQLLEVVERHGTIGSHTVFHPLLERCSEDVGRRECAESRRILEGLLGGPVWHFALPDGSGGREVRSWVVNAGYRTCRTTTPGWVTPRSDPLAISNFGIADDADVHKAVVQACGLWSFLKRVCIHSLQ